MLNISSNPAYSDAIELFEQACDGYRRFHVLKAAIDLGLFTWLAEFGPASSSKIAEAMALDARYIDPFLQSLTEDGFLQAHGTKLCLSDAAAKLQAIGAPVRPAQLLSRASGATAKWPDLVSMLCGRDVVGEGAGHTECEVAVCPGDYYHAERSVRQWVGFASAEWLLDLGGTKGDLSIALCTEHSRLHASIMVCAGERRGVTARIAEAGLAERIELIEGDLFSVQFHREYDIALAVHSLYAYPKRILEAMEKIAEATRPFGLLVTQHWFDDARDAQVENAVRELDQRLHWTRKPLRHAEAFADRVTSAGFSWLKGQNLPVAKQGLQLRLALHCDENAQFNPPNSSTSVRRAPSALSPANLATPAL
jgi:SAM-dependent methyltransferase